MATATRTYKSEKREQGVARTRAQIMAAVRTMLADGSFHTASVEEVAERAGVARATLYLHFGSRLGLVDAICDSFGDNPSMRAIKTSHEIEDPARAMLELISSAVAFWASEEPLHHQLYGLAVIDAAAAEFAARQRNDRRSIMGLAAERLAAASLLRRGVGVKRATSQLMVLTSFATYEELRSEGLDTHHITALLREQARAQLLSG